MTNPPIILVPGFWLGAWAWDEVAAALRADGHEVTALTLPGLELVEVDRTAITLEDHVEAICTAVRAAGRPVVLAVHSGAAVPGYGASDRVPELIAAMAYVDTAPAARALDPDFRAVEKPLPSPDELEAEENLTGLTVEHLATFRGRAVPEPGAALREAPRLTNDARRDIPSTIDLHRVLRCGLPGRRRRRPRVPERPAGAAERHLDRSADEPLAHVVAPPGARDDPGRHRDGARPGGVGQPGACGRSGAGCAGRRGGLSATLRRKIERAISAASPQRATRAIIGA